MVPLDGSTRAESALPHALIVARAFGARLHLLRVVEAPGGGSSVMDILTHRHAHGEAASYLQAVAERLGDSGVPVETQVTEGKPADQIVQCIATAEIDLLVLTTHGGGAEVDFELGGTVRKTLERAGISVVLVPGRMVDPHGAVAPRYRRVLVGVDCSRRAEWALSLGAILAQAEGAELVVVHVVRVPESPTEGERLAKDLVSANREAASHYLERIAGRLRSPRLRVRTILEVAGGVAEALAGIQAGESPDLTILCAHGATGDGARRYGSVAERFLSSGHGVIAVLQDLPRPGPLSTEDAPPRAATASATL